MNKKTLTYVSIVLVIAIGVVYFLAHRTHSNPLFHKTWVATTFTYSNGTVQHNPSESVSFSPKSVHLRIGATVNVIPIKKYSIINNLHQGDTPYSTVLVYESATDYIRVFVFKNGDDILIIKGVGANSVQQRFKSNG